MAHIHLLYDFTVSAFIIHEDRVLLLHHKKLKTWLQPGGHVELNEDPETALWREIEEETSLKQENLEIIELQNKKLLPNLGEGHKQLPLPFDINVHPFGTNQTHKRIDMCYLMRSNTDAIAKNIVESNDLKWFTRANLEKAQQDLWPDIYQRATFALNVAL